MDCCCDFGRNSARRSSLFGESEVIVASRFSFAAWRALSLIRFSLDQFHLEPARQFQFQIFQGGGSFRAVGEQPDTSQFRSERSLRSDADFTLGLANIIKQRRQFCPQGKSVLFGPRSFDGESSKSDAGRSVRRGRPVQCVPQRPFQGRVAFTAGGAEDVAIRPCACMRRERWSPLSMSPRMSARATRAVHLASRRR